VSTQGIHKRCTKKKQKKQKKPGEELTMMKLVTFDLDGVLQNNPFGGYVLPTLARIIGPYWRGLPPQFLSPLQQGITPTPEQIRLPGLDRKGREIIAAIFAQTALWLQSGQLRDTYDWDAAATTVARAVDCHEAFDVAQLVEEGCRQGHISAFEGAAKILQELSGRGHVLVGVSNGFTRYQQPVLEALGLYAYFATLISPEETGTAKPDPAIFHVAAERIGAHSAASAFHIGDTLIHDIAGAKAANMRVLWMCPSLPEAIASCEPVERPEHPQILSLLAARSANEFAAQLYDFSPEQLVPDAVIVDLFEVPATIEKLAAWDQPA
jgi:putative hydrolase of the HAD superfamily